VYVYDETKLYYFEKFIKDAKNRNIRVFIVNSPKYSNGENKLYEPIAAICLKNEVPFIDMENDELSNNVELFRDVLHLNSEGSILYTNKIIKCLN